MRRCGSTSGATAAPRASSRTTSTPRSPPPGSGCAASTSCWTATGWTPLLTATGQLMDYTERVLRQRIAEIPDGEYRAEGFLDDDGRNRDVRLPIKVCVRVKGDGIEIDLTGSADQVETGFNASSMFRCVKNGDVGGTSGDAIGDGDHGLEFRYSFPYPVTELRQDAAAILKRVESSSRPCRGHLDHPRVPGPRGGAVRHRLQLRSSGRYPAAGLRP